jgi:hypothetical protein
VQVAFLPFPSVADELPLLGLYESPQPARDPALKVSKLGAAENHFSASQTDPDVLGSGMAHFDTKLKRLLFTLETDLDIGNFDAGPEVTLLQCRCDIRMVEFDPNATKRNIGHSTFEGVLRIQLQEDRQITSSRQLDTVTLTPFPIAHLLRELKLKVAGTVVDALTQKAGIPTYLHAVERGPNDDSALTAEIAVGNAWNELVQKESVRFRIDRQNETGEDASVIGDVHPQQLFSQP